ARALASAGAGGTGDRKGRGGDCARARCARTRAGEREPAASDSRIGGGPGGGRTGVRLSHVDEAGRARMVDVAAKPATVRTAVSGALLTVYDMVKAVDRGMEIDRVRLLEKTGGTHGDWRRDSAD